MLLLDMFANACAAMLGGFAASELWSMDFWASTAGCVFLLFLANATHQ